MPIMRGQGAYTELAMYPLHPKPKSSKSVLAIIAARARDRGVICPGTALKLASGRDYHVSSRTAVHDVALCQCRMMSVLVQQATTPVTSRQFTFPNSGRLVGYPDIDRRFAD